MRLDARRAVLLIVDVQERLAAAMPPEALAACQRNLLVLCELARQLRLPVVLSEQYPKGLGPTLGPVTKAVADLSPVRLEKMHFSCAAAPEFAAIRTQLGRSQWIVGGMETHVCVYQTARDLAAMGDEVHVPHDAVVSRPDENVRRGLALIERAGAYVTTTETVVFDALGQAGTEAFRALSRLVK